MSPMGTRTSADVKRVVSDVLSGAKIAVDNALSDSGTGPRVNARLQAMFKTRHRDLLASAVHQTILTHAVSAERTGPGCLATFMDALGERVVDKAEGVVLGRHATRDDIWRAVDRCCQPARPFVREMVREALTLAGFGGRVIVEKTPSMTPSVELVRGYTFEVRLGFPIDFSVANPRIACVDGFVESVSEVHHLLEAASASREPCVFFARGLTDDVIHTLRVNHDRGTLRVFPAIVPFDLDGMNTLVDIAVVSGSDVVSSLKGELISSIDFHQLPTVERVTSFRGNTVIVESRTAQTVRTHVARLRSRRADERVDEVGRLLDRRIRSLSPNHVVIRLPEGRDFVVNSQAVDLSLRTVRSCVERGMGDDGEPALSRPIAMIHAQRCQSTLASLGAAIV